MGREEIEKKRALWFSPKKLLAVPQFFISGGY
jgi:hypothetical protein